MSISSHGPSGPRDSAPADSAPRTTTRPHVVVIGSGFGGLFGAKALRDADVDVTVIGKTTYHLFQPLLYQVATGVLSVGEVAPPTREILRKQTNTRVVLGEVREIDVAHRTVTSYVLERRTVTPYDLLIVAPGSKQSYFGMDQFAEFAPGMKSVDDALELRGRIFGAFELAETLDRSEEDLDRLLTFVVIGAGPTGVEMAGQLAELTQRTLRRDFRKINTRHARIILLDAASQVLPPMGEKIGKTARKRLERLGIEVQLGTLVVGVDERGIEVEDKDGTRRRIEALTKVWAAGVEASPLGMVLAEQTGAALDRAGRLALNPDLTLPGHPEVFVVGDMIGFQNLPGVAQVAIQSSRYAASEIKRRVEGKPSQGPFKYFDKGNMAIISRFQAVALIGRFRFSGFPAWILWLGVHLFYLTAFKHRVSVLMHWTISFIGRGRSQRTATEQQIFGRAALGRLEKGAADLVSPAEEPTTVSRDRPGSRTPPGREDLEAKAAEESRLTDTRMRGTRTRPGPGRAA
jgi:NADH:ubiquinone reductase (H+-translocating)